VLKRSAGVLPDTSNQLVQLLAFPDPRRGRPPGAHQSPDTLHEPLHTADAAVTELAALVERTQEYQIHAQRVCATTRDVPAVCASPPSVTIE
jgi:hypothetical protein